LRIVLVGHAYPPYPGGLSDVLYNLSEEFVKLGHEVKVITLSSHPGVSKTQVSPGLEVFRVQGFAPSNAYFFPHPSMLKLIGAFEADVLHAHNIGALTVPMAALAHWLFRKRSRLVISPHHHAKGSKTHTRMAWLAYKPFAQKTLRAADKVHAVSPYEASLLHRDFGIDPVLVPNGIGSDVFGYGWQPPQGEAIITYAGRMERYKRVESLVRALSIAQRMTGRKARLRLTGSRDGVGAVMDLGRTLSVQIEQLGYLPREDYLTRLAGSTVLANVSRYEAYSLVTAEALAMGVPVVVSKPWGYDFSGPKTTLVDGEDVEEIAGALAQRILGSQEGTGGKIAVPTWRVTAKRIVEELYE